jgi:UDP-glucose 4-epimerase
VSKKAIVFGGSGFLGSHVADELLRRGFEVTIFDNSRPQYLQKGQRFIQGDILDLNACESACSGNDYVYNFAGLADINEAKDKPLLTAHLNIIGQVNVLEAARKANAKRFVYASTVYVYSESGSFYRVSKQAGEKYTELYGEKYNLPYTILRYGSLYGPRADHRNAIYRFVESALSEGKIHYKGTGEELREYVHVVDAARASVDILSPDFLNQHIVITGPQLLRIKDVISMIKEMLPDREIQAVYENEDMEAHYNITPYAYKPRLGRKLTVNPFVDLGQGVLECVDQAFKRNNREWESRS